ncbi:unnamed protein product [Paramecium octaurelia]|uniref:Uncharacterized protein n=1 Tax=Paramecium octaurelia TaxID=43137 RepID=A0A8S1Y2B0_PAROT|nr:unnamed protein product [Paramecium octaurelia]
MTNPSNCTTFNSLILTYMLLLKYKGFTLILLQPIENIQITTIYIDIAEERHLPHTKTVYIQIT